MLIQKFFIPRPELVLSGIEGLSVSLPKIYACYANYHMWQRKERGDHEKHLSMCGARLLVSHVRALRGARKAARGLYIRLAQLLGASVDRQGSGPLQKIRPRYRPGLYRR